MEVIESIEPQCCFVGDDGYRRCNYIMRGGRPRRTKSGKWWRFPAWPFKANKQGKVQEVKGETATPVSE